MVRYAMYKGKGLIGNALVRWFKRSKYSHCELLVDGVCYSSSVMDGGVRGKVIELDPDKWDLIDIPWADRDAILGYFKQTAGQRYSWLSILGAQFVAADYDEPKAAFCSEWCAAALGFPFPVTYSPEVLGRLIEFINGVKQ